MWTQACSWWVGARVCLRSGGPAVSRKNQHPQLGWEKPAAEWGTWCLGNRPDRPRAVLKEQDSYFIPPGGERAMHTLSNLWLPCSAVSDSSSRQNWACGKFLPSPQKAAVEKDRQQDENGPWWRQTPWKDANKCSKTTELDYTVKTRFIEYKRK